MEGHNTHGWIISAFLREMADLEAQDTFKCVESKFSFDRCLRRGSVEAPGVRQKNGHAASLSKGRNRNSFEPIRTEEKPDWQLRVGRQLLDHVPFQKSPRTDDMRLNEDPESWDLAKKTASLWWTSTYDSEEKSDLSIETKTGHHKFPFRRKIQRPRLHLEWSREDARVS